MHRFNNPPQFNFAESIVDSWARKTPESPALWCVDVPSGVEAKFTFAQVAAQSCRTANFLQQCGIKRGDRVLLMLPRVPEWWFCMLGLIRLGAVPVPATLLLTARDVEFRLQGAGVTAVITNPEGWAKVGGFDGIRITVGGDAAGWMDLPRGIQRCEATFDFEPTGVDDPGILYFTSATTGDPKMVMHTQGSYGLGHKLTGKYWLDLKAGEVHWNISDLGWGKAAWSSFYGPWHMGACVFALNTAGKFDPRLTLDTLENFPINTWCAPPTALRLIVRQELAHRRFPHLRHCVTAGEPLNPEVYSLWRGATGLELYEAYGQTETVVMVGNFRSLNRPIRPGSMGSPTPGMDVQIIDEKFAAVPAGKEGEIALRIAPDRPAGLFAGYWLNPDEDARKFKQGWYLTGDRAVRDSEGYFWFLGRNDDVIKSSGYRIGPFEVESTLIEHPSVLEAAVIGKPDPLRGQIVKAYVILRPGLTGDEALVAELQQHCKSLIAAYKYPREIEFVSELPKTTSGKTRHFALRQNLQCK